MAPTEKKVKVVKVKEGEIIHTDKFAYRIVNGKPKLIGIRA